MMMMMRSVKLIGRGARLPSSTVNMGLRFTQTYASESMHLKDSEKTRNTLMSALKPKEVVDQLNKFIVGQPDAKRAVAIALRNRWRRHQLSDELRNEVIPKNILMIGPTGCGKTEIARRIAKLSQAPFIKVEATKYTEVGFHGKDVDQIIRDLLDVSINMTKKRIRDDVKQDVASVVEERLLDLLVGTHSDEAQREAFRSLLREKALEERIVEIEVPHKPPSGGDKGFAVEVSANATFVMNELMKLSKMGGPGAGKSKNDRRKMTLAEARPIIEEIEIEKVIEEYDVTKEAIAAVEESGIVFIDEIDKLISGSDHKSADASAEGVQRDLLPLIEGSTISTKHGNVNTDFILFIASGAFHSSKPSDLLAELQGRLPIRVSLKGLTEDDLYRILTEPVTNLIRQQIEMMKSENVELVFTDDAVREIAKIAFETNKTIENIGARRLHTIIEKVVEDISFEAPERQNEKIEINAEYVRQKMGDLLKTADMRKYIL